MMIFAAIITAAVAYLIGGLNGAIIISHTIFRKDVRGYGSGNAGLTNFMRAFGSGQAALVVLIDFLKGILACVIGALALGRFGYQTEGEALAGLFVVLGHMFPAYYHFKGGKGIMTGAAVALVVDWRIFVTVVLLFLVVTALTKIVSAGSIMAAVALPVSSLVFHPGNYVLLAPLGLIACLVVFMHRGNIVRMVHGEENKLTLDQFRKR